jgi:hypothetical protein
VLKIDLEKLIGEIQPDEDPVDAEIEFSDSNGAVEDTDDMTYLEQEPVSSPQLCDLEYTR